MGRRQPARFASTTRPAALAKVGIGDHAGGFDARPAPRTGRPIRRCEAGISPGPRSRVRVTEVLNTACIAQVSRLARTTSLYSRPQCAIIEVVFWRSGERPTDARPEVQPNRDAVGRTPDSDPHGSDFERRKRVAAVVGVLVALAIAACGGGGPTGPTPAPIAVSITERTTLVGLGENVCTTYRLSRPPRMPVKIVSLFSGPGVSIESDVHFPINYPIARFRTPSDVWGLGDWTVRILGDRLPDGVVLGSPSSATTTVQEAATGVDCSGQG